VKQRLGVTFVGARFGNELDGAICGRGVRGEAVFNFRSGAARLHAIALTGGVRTAEGVAPGSSVRALKRAYGRRLILDKDPDIHTGDADVVHSAHRCGYDLVFMADGGRVVSIGLNTSGVLDVHCPTVATRPPPTFGVVSLASASGLQPVMPIPHVLATWPWFPLLTDSAGSGWDSWMPVCAGATHGMVSFGGGALAGVWFSSGAFTDNGISIGSSLADLQNAYGSDLQALNSASYFVYAGGPPPVATLGFRVGRGVVTALGFGGRQGIGGTGVPDIWC
jgi:hypothetical protein